METRNAAAAAKAGRQRAATHNNIGNSSATGATVFQDSSGSEMEIPVMTASAARALAPSLSSLRGGEPNHQRCNGDDADCVGREPVLPRGQDFRRWAVEQPVCNGSADPRDHRADDRCDKQAKDLDHPIEVEIGTEVELDQFGGNQ